MLRSVVWGSIRFRFVLAALAAGLVILGVSQLPRVHSDVLPETGLLFLTLPMALPVGVCAARTTMRV